VNGTAEATSLDAASMDLVIAGQACHWFEPEAVSDLFQRCQQDGVVRFTYTTRLYLGRIGSLAASLADARRC
jgi:hypothetical protein